MGKYTKANLRNQSPQTIINNTKPDTPREWWRSPNEFKYKPEYYFPDPEGEEAEKMLKAYNLSSPVQNAGRTRRRRRKGTKHTRHKKTN